MMVAKWLGENSLTLFGWIINFVVIYLTSVYGVRGHKENLKFDEKHEAYKDICDKYSVVHEKEAFITGALERLPADEGERVKAINKKASDFAAANNELSRALDKYAYILNEAERKKLNVILHLLVKQGTWYMNYNSSNEAEQKLGQDDQKNVYERSKKIRQEYSNFFEMIS